MKILLLHKKAKIISSNYFFDGCHIRVATSCFINYENRVRYNLGFMIFCKEKIIDEFKSDGKDVPALITRFKEHLNKFEMKNNNFDKLVDKFLDTNELGHYSKEDFSIMLYDIKNDIKTIQRIIADIESITKKYKIIVLNPNSEDYTNINILDIEL